MASLIRTRQLNLLTRFMVNRVVRDYRYISTSKKNSDTAAASVNSSTCSPKKEKNENWVSYGYDYKDQKADTDAHNASYFFSVTLCLVFGGFLWAYSPDVHLRDWAQREAFLELRRREKANAPLICPNYINPQLVRLPCEEDLEGVEIII